VECAGRDGMQGLKPLFQSFVYTGCLLICISAKEKRSSLQGGKKGEAGRIEEEKVS